MVITRVNPLSAGKVAGIIGIVIGLVVGGLLSLLVMAAGGAAAAVSDEPAGAFAGMLFGAGAVVVLPLF